MVLTGSVLESDYPTSSAHKIKIRQVAEAASPVGHSGSRAGSRTRMAESSCVTRSSITNGAATPLHPKLRKILVQESGGGSRNSAESGGGGGAARGARKKPGAPASVEVQPEAVRRRARTASPVLAHSSRQGHLQQGILKRSLLRLRPSKCVSFSSDTSFLEGSGSGSGKTPPVHESKLYRKGVLQDRESSSSATGAAAELHETNLPLSWEESLGGPRALLGAAQDGDDELIGKILTLGNKAGLGNVDLNALDTSGRTAISYMAGNGSALMLEACLSFRGADANLPDKEGNTPLHFAAQAGQTECLNILLQRCPTIEVDARNSLGFTPLMKAALQGRTKCAKILLFAGGNPTLRDHGRGLRAEQWARFCGRYVCAEVIERFARHRLLEKTSSCRWGSEPELAAQLLQGKLMAVPSMPVQPPSSGLKSKIRRVFRTSSSSDKSFSLVSQLTSAALCASSPVLPKPGDVSPALKTLLRPLSVPQLRITLVAPQDIVEKTSDKCSHSTSFTEKIESTMAKPPRTKKKSK